MPQSTPASVNASLSKTHDILVKHLTPDQMRDAAAELRTLTDDPEASYFTAMADALERGADRRREAASVPLEVIILAAVRYSAILEVQGNRNRAGEIVAAVNAVRSA